MTGNDIIAHFQQIASLTPRQYGARRVTVDAEALHRENGLLGQIAQAMSALAVHTGLVYRPSRDGEFDNIDPATCRIKIPNPWGSKGHAKYGLSRREAEILRQCLKNPPKSSKRPPLFYYLADENDWFLNRRAYRNLDEAAVWLRHEGISLAQWRQAGVEVRGGITEGKQKGNKGEMAYA